MASSTVRQQAVTTVQQTRSSGTTSPILDKNLDALLEDLQTSVSRPSSAMNGVATGPAGGQTYCEVTTHTVQQNKSPGGGHKPQIQYLSAANPTTFVSERAVSPGMDLLQQTSGDQRVMSYKTVSYQYNTTTNASPAPISGLVVDGAPVRSVLPAADPTSDARLQQNLNELDNLLVDLHQAQKAGFGTEQTGGIHSEVVTTTRNTSGVDASLLEPIEHSTPTPPVRQQIQQVSRTVHQRTYVDGGGSSPSPARYSNEMQSSPRLQPKRSSSANRELTYGTVETQHHTRSPSPSPRVPQRTVVHKDTYYEAKNATTPKQERYRDKSPTNRRLQRELFYESKSSTPVPPSPRQERYHDHSPPNYKRGTPVHYTNQPSSEPYTNQPNGSSSKVTTIRTYNYNTSGTSAPSPVPPVSRSPYPSSGAPSPAPVVELPHRSPSPYGVPPGTSTTTTYGSLPGTKVTTTVRTYTYELPGQPGTSHQYPPSHDPSHPPVYDSNDFGPSDRTLTYQVSPPPPREKEPLLEPLQQTPPPTVITYKYSTHSSHTTSSKFPQHPEEQQHLLPRPFPTPSPTPGSTVDGQPPKRLDELMASFSDTENQHHDAALPPGGYYGTEKHPVQQKPQTAEPINGAAVMPVSAKATASASASANASAAAKERPKTKNVAGPPVYYPPGVELFAKKEESMMAGNKASGRYEYEYESKSKSKSSSSGGAAVVPVCLPLCCAMPCVII